MNTAALKVSTPTDRTIVMTRSFDAPLRLVWEAMTKPEFIKRWLFLPPGWAMTVCQEDVRIGGAYHWAWAGPDGKTAMAIRGVYREVDPPERMVRTEIFEFGGAPQAGEQLCTLEFAEQEGKTHLRLTALYPSKEARDGMLASNMEHGVSTGYNNLETLLKEMVAQ